MNTTNINNEAFKECIRRLDEYIEFGCDHAELEETKDILLNNVEEPAKAVPTFNVELKTMYGTKTAIEWRKMTIADIVKIINVYSAAENKGVEVVVSAEEEK